MSSDPRIPPREKCVLRYILDHWKDQSSEKVFVKFGTGDELTYKEIHEVSVQAGIGLQSIGVEQGDHVLTWLPNGLDNLRLFFGVNYIGAVHIPINTAFKGNILERVIQNSDAKVMAVHKDLVPRLKDVELGILEKIIVIGGEAETIGGLETMNVSSIASKGGELKPLIKPIEPWDTQMILYTSGTTGPSKGVLLSYLNNYTIGHPKYFPFITVTDRFLVNLPMFHSGGAHLTLVMLQRGASIAMVESFDTTTIWQTVRETGATAMVLIGVMASFLMKAPPNKEDRNHGLRVALMAPLTSDSTAFAQRFGIDIYTYFNMTETTTPTISEPNPTNIATCGKARADIEIRLVDENDCEVSVGSVGEMILHSDCPWTLNHGYYKDPEATAKAWRNGWFHTGDVFRKDEEGYYYFIDRKKDAIRRRGENISSFEVEEVVATHPAVQEVAAIPVPSEMEEDEVMVVLAQMPGETLDPVELIDFLKIRMAHFMIPRYIRVVAALPKTLTNKVQKNVLRSEGITPDTWDREAAGIKIKRERIGEIKVPHRKRTI